MAFITSCVCHTCGESWSTAVDSRMPTPIECPGCKAKREDAKRQERSHFNDLDKLALEERLRRVEEWIYDYERFIK